MVNLPVSVSDHTWASKEGFKEPEVVRRVLLSSGAVLVKDLDKEVKLNEELEEEIEEVF